MQPEERVPENRATLIGRRLRAEREKKGLTRHDLSMQTGIRENNIGGWERGERLPTVEHLATIASALGLSISTLLDEGPTQSKGNTRHEQQLLASQAV